MKDFLKYTLASMTGMILLGVIMGILGIISIVGMVASESATAPIEDNSVFVLSLKGMVEERSSGDINPLNYFSGNTEASVGLNDILHAIKVAKENDKIKGIYIESGIVAFDSYATARTLRNALIDFKKSGKWVVAYADSYLQGAYYVSTAADKVYMDNFGSIDLKGIGTKAEYYKGLYDKIGIRYDATRVGKYKSYVERNTRTNMSPEDREQRMAYMQGLWNIITKDIAASRHLTATVINKYANDSLMALADQQSYIKMKLIDKVMYPDEVKSDIKKRLDLKEDDDIKQVSVSDLADVSTDEKDDGDEVAVYYATGEIVDQSLTDFTGEQNIVGSKMSQDIMDLAKDDDVKAVVIRVNSPGGSATAAEQIWHAINVLKTKKPVVVSMGGVAASGGYMISAPANVIYAEPATITGSIGIFGMFPNFSGLLTDKLGITFDNVQTNKYTNFMENLTLNKDNSVERGYLQNYINRGYDQFLTIVSEGRHMTKSTVNEIAQGRVWLANDGVRVKLVDKIGTLDDAVKKAAQLAKLSDYHQQSYPELKGWWESIMDQASGNKGNYLDSQLREILGDQYEQYIFLRTINKRAKLQARLPFSTRVK